VRAVVKADTPAATATKGNEQYSAPWVVESPGGTVTTSAYNDRKKRCLSAEGGSDNPKKKVSEQNNHKHLPWHNDHEHATHNERRRGQRPLQHD
jgi:hypothetical protein